MDTHAWLHCLLLLVPDGRLKSILPTSSTHRNARHDRQVKSTLATGLSLDMAAALQPCQAPFVAQGRAFTLLPSPRPLARTATDSKQGGLGRMLTRM